MRIRARWPLGVLAIAGLVVASTSTFTASTTAPTTQQVGYVQTTVTGGTVSDVAYTLDTSNPPNVTGMSLTVDTSGITSTSAPAVQFAFNSAAMAACTAGAWSPPQSSTTYTCTPGSPLASTSLSSTAISIATQ